MVKKTRRVFLPKVRPKDDVVDIIDRSTEGAT